MEKDKSRHFFEAYTDYVLTHQKQPSSVYVFCKEVGEEESEFYKYFASFSALEESVFSTLFEETMTMLHNTEEFSTYDNKTKLLSFYFTFFELLTANRSLITYLLKAEKHDLKQLSKLKELRTLFQAFIKSMEINMVDIPKEKVQKIQDKAIGELAWGQFLLTLKFWMEDTSPSFEKTDVFIEKSVHASFDLMDLTPLKNIIDFGKFLWKEKMKM
jgi:hypothetical protein